MGSNDQPRQYDAPASQLKTTSIPGRVTRRAFLRAVAIGSAGLGLLACTPAATVSPTAPAARPTEPAKPDVAGAPTGAPVAAASKPTETPRRGGELVYVVSAEPPSYDGHKE